MPMPTEYTDRYGLDPIDYGELVWLVHLVDSDQEKARALEPDNWGSCIFGKRVDAAIAQLERLNSTAYETRVNQCCDSAESVKTSVEALEDDMNYITEHIGDMSNAEILRMVGNFQKTLEGMREELEKDVFMEST